MIGRDARIVEEDEAMEQNKNKSLNQSYLIERR
jgi:hypothetical protein